MTTYAELVQNIKDFMEDDGTEFSNEIDKFIDLSELRLSRDLKTPEFRRKVTSAFTANDPFLTMPTDLVLLENLHLINSNVRSILLLKSDILLLNSYMLLLKSDILLLRFHSLLLKSCILLIFC